MHLVGYTIRTFKTRDTNACEEFLTAMRRSEQWVTLWCIEPSQTSCHSHIYSAPNDKVHDIPNRLQSGAETGDGLTSLTDNNTTHYGESQDPAWLPYI